MYGCGCGGGSRVRKWNMELRITLVLLACGLVVDAGLAHLAGKAKLLTRLKGHHKRGAIPTYKLGHDIPHVTHSLLKPLVVTYPPTATVSAVKVPLKPPPGYPVSVGHRVPGLPHPHYGLKFPHFKSDHYHHHHHHVAPTPVVRATVVPAPVVPAPVVPVAHAAPAPVVPLPQPAPIPLAPTPLVLPAPAVAPAPIPLAPPPFNFLAQNNLFRAYRPILPAAVAPLQPAVLPPQPVPYVIRPGGAIQTSVFATYPRYPLLNSYQAPLFPLAPAAPQQLFLQHPQVPQFNVVHGGETGVIDHHAHVAVDQPHLHAVSPQPEILVHPTQETLPQTPIHLHPAQDALPQTPILHPTQIPHPAVLQAHPTVSLDHNGWSPVQPTQQPEVHYPNVHQLTQEQTHHDDQFNDYQHQLQHALHQIEQAQYEHNLNNHNVGQEYGTPQQTYGQPNEYPQHGQDFFQNGQQFSQHAQDFSQQGQDFSQNGQGYSHHGQDFSQQGQDFSQNGQGYSHQGQDFSQQGQDFSQNGQDFSQNGQGYSQHGQDFSQHGQDFHQQYDVSQQYGVPQGVEGRSGEAEDSDLYHNLIPLALQPPIDRPLENFR